MTPIVLLIQALRVRGRERLWVPCETVAGSPVPATFDLKLGPSLWLRLSRAGDVCELQLCGPGGPEGMTAYHFHPGDAGYDDVREVFRQVVVVEANRAEHVADVRRLAEAALPAKEVRA